ncbi:hypothetical protein FSS13T_09300 [Flavobacterium saliperosum S13]|uniref:Lipoprotein n=2 Tax=Flavobacterium saliperosum TaxID=329186 RepID=A0A1G4VW58_9FLAO|nr:hypothetical protein [Flavobacterium saliperosum]ESU26764.1 hypothetical protein FSS13T_09300 [Flavobacterium saliperosum S13]SCX12796.1 hypothetical protein SAMN02927925_01856 [Flavobacterium saliperosum]
MRNLFLFTLLFSVLSCSKKETSKEELVPYIISIDEKKNPVNRLSNSITYGLNNFIIDNKGNIFYFEPNESETYTHFQLINDTIPEFINLQPTNLIQIPVNSIDEFVKLNFKKGQKNITHVSSQLDTLNSVAFYKLKDALKKYSYELDRDFYGFRRTRQEEDTVLHYKKENKYYSSEDIKWDKSKIKFTKNYNEISPSSK